MTGTPEQTISIEQTVRIAATPATVWQFWTDAELLVEWWGVDAEVVAEPGGRYRVVMAGGQVIAGAFTELDPPNRLVFTFGREDTAPGEPLAPGSTSVEVTFVPDGEGTVLTLRHTAMPAAHAADHQKGWAYLLGERLVAAAGARHQRRRVDRCDWSMATDAYLGDRREAVLDTLGGGTMRIGHRPAGRTALPRRGSSRPRLRSRARPSQPTGLRRCPRNGR